MAVIAIIAQGAMGAGIGRRLAGKGATVLTSLAGRSAASAQRAAAAGMRDATAAEIAGADIFLSVLPPAEAKACAAWLAPALAAGAAEGDLRRLQRHQPGHRRRGRRHHRPDRRGLRRWRHHRRPAAGGWLYAGALRLGAGGGAAGAAARPRARCPVTPGPIGAASALKMSYAGITKGLVALSPP